MSPRISRSSRLISRRQIALSLPVLGLTACSARRPEPIPATSGPVRPPVAIRPPRFGDADPVEFVGQNPAGFAVHGIDAARFQQSVDWRIARKAGVNFAFVKATEGGDLLDPKFRDHWRGARRAGVPVGAYHFYYFCTEPEVQARWFIRHVSKHSGMLPPVLDAEWNPFSPTCTLRPPATTVRRKLNRFLSIIRAHYGMRPIVYTTPGFYKDNDMRRVTGVDFWLRTTAKTPAEAYPGQPWRFWQYTATGLVPGIEGKTDLNVFNGSSADWQAWLNSRRA